MRKESAAKGRLTNHRASDTAKTAMRRVPAGMLSALTTSLARRELFDEARYCQWQYLAEKFSRRLSKRTIITPRIAALVWFWFQGLLAAKGLGRGRGRNRAEKAIARYVRTH